MKRSFPCERSSSADEEQTATVRADRPFELDYPADAESLWDVELVPGEGHSTWTVRIRRRGIAPIQAVSRDLLSFSVDGIEREKTLAIPVVAVPDTHTNVAGAR